MAHRPVGSPADCCATAGSVDDGKSTLIGRLLYDSKSLHRPTRRPALRVTSRC